MGTTSTYFKEASHWDPGDMHCPVTSLDSIFLHPLILEFCIFVSLQLLIRGMREERGVGSSGGNFFFHLWLLASLACHSVFSADAARHLCWPSWWGKRYEFRWDLKLYEHWDPGSTSDWQRPWINHMSSLNSTFLVCKTSVWGFWEVVMQLRWKH